MSHSGANESHRLIKKTPGAEAFSRCFDEYYRVVSEESDEVVWEKRQIEGTYANQLRVLDNFRKSRVETIFQEGFYLEQLRADGE
jgi:hypothetical protein